MSGTVQALEDVVVVVVLAMLGWPRGDLKFTQQGSNPHVQ